MKMWEQIAEIYSKDRTFLDFLARDLEDGAVWFNNSEFARWHEVKGKKILAIFTSDVRSKKINTRLNEQNSEGVTDTAGVLFFRARDIRGVINAGSQLKFDGELYTVAEARLIQDQIWRVVLEGKE